MNFLTQPLITHYHLLDKSLIKIADRTNFLMHKRANFTKDAVNILHKNSKFAANCILTISLAKFWNLNFQFGNPTSKNWNTFTFASIQRRKRRNVNLNL